MGSGSLKFEIGDLRFEFYSVFFVPPWLILFYSFVVFLQKKRSENRNRSLSIIHEINYFFFFLSDFFLSDFL